MAAPALAKSWKNDEAAVVLVIEARRGFGVRCLLRGIGLPRRRGT
jgi:hypothetical protein